MGIIRLQGMEFFAYHGCFKEEQIIGNKFIVDLDFVIDVPEAEHEDDLSKTINYQTVYTLVKNEMKLKSNLLENIALRIYNSIITSCSGIKHINITVKKINPPLGGKLDYVSYTLSK